MVGELIYCRLKKHLPSILLLVIVRLWKGMFKLYILKVYLTFFLTLITKTEYYIKVFPDLNFPKVMYYQKDKS